MYFLIVKIYISCSTQHIVFHGFTTYDVNHIISPDWHGENYIFHIHEINYDIIEYNKCNCLKRTSNKW